MEFVTLEHAKSFLDKGIPPNHRPHAVQRLKKALPCLHDDHYYIIMPRSISGKGYIWEASTEAEMAIADMSRSCRGTAIING